MSADYTEDDTLPVLVDVRSPALMRITTDAVHQCPFKNETDEGELEVTYAAGDQSIELHSLKAWLDTLDEWEVSHEAYTHHVRDTLETVGVKVLTCVTRWTTAGMKVEVTV